MTAVIVTLGYFRANSRWAQMSYSTTFNMRGAIEESEEAATVAEKQQQHICKQLLSLLLPFSRPFPHLLNDQKMIFRCC